MSLNNLTVGDLKRALEEFDDDMLVVLAEDGEGNYFSTLVDTTTGYYIGDGARGDFISDEDALDDEDLNLNDAVPALVLWPAD